MDTPMTPDSLEARNAEIKVRLAEINSEYEGQALPEGARSEWDALHEEREENNRLAAELRARVEVLEQLAEDDDRTESEFASKRFQTKRPNSIRNEDVFDLSEYRRLSSTPEQERDLLVDGAKRAAEQAYFPHDQAYRPDVERNIERLLTSTEHRDGAAVARRIVGTGSKAYARAFTKKMAGAEHSMTSEERAAFAVGTAGSSAAIPVPYVVDPTVVPTSNWSVNPWRQICRVESITGTIWRGVTSGAITAAYAAEATEASDNTPTLAQPEIQTERAQAFVPFSIEADQDWSGLQAEMARLIQDAKDDLEATKFYSGAGHGSTEPLGIGNTTVTTVTTAGSGAFAIADVYTLLEQLPARFRPRATWVSNLYGIDKVRQFDTAGGAGLVARLPQAGAGQPGSQQSASGLELLGRPLYESTAINTNNVLTAGTNIFLIGDFSYYCIVERVGLNVEVIPHLFGGSANYPTGQRGLYAMWRNSGEPLSTAAFRLLQTKA